MESWQILTHEDIAGRAVPRPDLAEPTHPTSPAAGHPLVMPLRIIPSAPAVSQPGALPPPPSTLVSPSVAVNRPSSADTTPSFGELWADVLDYGKSLISWAEGLFMEKSLQGPLPPKSAQAANMADAAKEVANNTDDIGTKLKAETDSRLFYGFAAGYRDNILSQSYAGDVDGSDPINVGYRYGWQQAYLDSGAPQPPGTPSTSGTVQGIGCLPRNATVISGGGVPGHSIGWLPRNAVKR